MISWRDVLTDWKRLKSMPRNEPTLIMSGTSTRWTITSSDRCTSGADPPALIVLVDHFRASRVFDELFRSCLARQACFDMFQGYTAWLIVSMTSDRFHEMFHNHDLCFVQVLQVICTECGTHHCAGRCYAFPNCTGRLIAQHSKDYHRFINYWFML